MSEGQSGLSGLLLGFQKDYDSVSGSFLVVTCEACFDTVQEHSESGVVLVRGLWVWAPGCLLSQSLGQLLRDRQSPDWIALSLSHTAVGHRWVDCDEHHSESPCQPPGCPALRNRRTQWEAPPGLINANHPGDVRTHPRQGFGVPVFGCVCGSGSGAVVGIGVPCTAAVSKWAEG